jgi:hypothetical protein
MTPEHLFGTTDQYIPVEVKYNRDFPRINFYESSLPDVVQGVLGTKAKA